MPTGKGILRQEQEAFPIRLPALAYFNKNDIFTRPVASACNVCVCVCVCLYKNCRQPNFQARKLPVQNRRNCVRFQKLHLSYKKSCVPFFVQYIYTLTINPSPPSGCNLNLCKDTTKKAHGQPTSMIFFPLEDPRFVQIMQNFATNRIVPVQIEIVDMAIIFIKCLSGDHI